LRTLDAKVFADPRVEQALEGGQGVVGAAILAARLGHLAGRDVRAFADAAHQLRGIEQVGELVAPQARAEQLLHIGHVAADQRVAALHVVIQEGERRAQREAVQPETDLRQFHRHLIEVYTVDAAFQHAPLEQVQVGQLAHINRHALPLHLFLDFAPSLRQFVQHGTPFEGCQELRHLVGDVIDGFDQKMSTAHRGSSTRRSKKRLFRRLLY